MKQKQRIMKNISLPEATIRLGTSLALPFAFILFWHTVLIAVIAALAVYLLLTSLFFFCIVKYIFLYYSRIKKVVRPSGSFSKSLPMQNLPMLFRDLDKIKWQSKLLNAKDQNKRTERDQGGDRKHVLNT